MGSSCRRRSEADVEDNQSPEPECKAKGKRAGRDKETYELTYKDASAGESQYKVTWSACG